MKVAYGIAFGEPVNASMDRARAAIVAMVKRVQAGKPAGVPRRVAMVLVVVADLDDNSREIIEAMPDERAVA